MKNYLLIGIVLLLAVAGYFVWNQQKPPSSSTTTQQVGTPGTSANFSFDKTKKTPHYEANVPEHGAVLAGVPVNIVINFNFGLVESSMLEILKDGKDYGTGERVIDATTVTLRRTMQADAPNGLYTVKYNACWPDGSCHDGNFQFAIDRSLSSQFSDQTSKKEATIKMSQIKFQPQNIKVSRDTKVIWVNDESVEHYVNTDPHAGHNYYRPQNSKLLKKGESFSFTFNQPGIYPYHCSAHASSMTGSLLVE